MKSKQFASYADMNYWIQQSGKTIISTEVLQGTECKIYVVYYK